MPASISLGTRLGRYEIAGLLDAGGMGEVYRAHDPVLGREVAIKVVMSGALDQGRVARFENEMRAIASVTHANILAVHDTGVADGIPFLVTELLDGESLREHLRSGALPARKVFAYATQILSGLQAAHRAGLVHLDLKPANLFVTTQGEIKILDFGIARLTRPAAGPVDPTQDTLPGEPALAGTLAYMAPEQLSAADVDQRADLFAFGLVCYEMLTGRPAFLRETRSETARAVLTEDPPDPSRSDIPAAAVAVIRRCLEKNPAERFQQAVDVRFALEAASGDRTTRDRTASRSPRHVLALAGVALLALLAVAAVVVAFTQNRARASAPVLRLSVVGPDRQTAGLGAAISNSGSLLVIVLTDQAGITRLWIQSLTDGGARPLDGTEGASYPFWSPDDAEIGFFAGRKLRIVSARGGAPRDVCDAPAGRGGTWAGDTILFAPSTETGLSRVRSAGGAAVQATTLDATRPELSHRFPSFMADGRHFVYLTMPRASGLEGSVMFASIDAPHQARRLLDSNAGAVWAPDDHLLFVRNGALWAQRFDRKSQALMRSPVGIASAIQIARFFGYPTFSVSRTGVVAYQPSFTESADVVWRGRNGDVLETIGLSGEFLTTALAPDQSAVAVTMREPQTGRPRLHVYDLRRRVLTPIGPADAESRGAAWSPDSERLAFSSNVRGQMDLYITRVSRPAQQDLLAEVGAFDLSADSWSRDGQLIYSASTPSGWAVRALSLRDSTEPPVSNQSRPLAVGPANQFGGQLSPTGRWLTVTSEETSRREVIAQTFPDPVSRRQVSANGGGGARWRNDGRELYFISASRQLMAVDVDERTGRFGVPHALFATYPADSGGNPVLYDVAPDGQRFLMVRPRPAALVPTTTVIVNWPSLLLPQ